ncbi:MAG: PilZ domain-containing protein [Deltaproteobacteria bacterium]|jgi:hypothetical protein|nr:PilZ domain-containing protein [Deltaproteobacteria bacterium]
MKISRSRIRNMLIKNLPSWVKPVIYRRMINFDPKGLGGLTCTIATSKEDLSAAFRLLHENYVQAGFMNPHPSGMRLTKYHTLPSTTTIVAKVDDEVVGTVSLVRNGLFGSPVEEIFDLSEYRQNGERVCEVSSLAVARKYSGQRGKILFPLLNYLYQYSEKCFRVDYLAIAVNPMWWDFYEHILLFKRLRKDMVGSYSFVNGAPAVGGILDLRTARENYKRVYGKQKLTRNLFEILGNLRIPGSKFPERKTGTISDPVMTPELLQYFFRNQSDVFENLSDQERIALLGMYRSPTFHAVLPMPSDAFVAPRPRKGGNRHDVELLCSVVSRSGKSFSGVLMNISASGALFKCDRGLRVDEILGVRVASPGNHLFELSSRVVWSTDNGLVGLEFLDQDFLWSKFVKTLEDRLLDPALQEQDILRKSA